MDCNGQNTHKKRSHQSTQGKWKCTREKISSLDIGFKIVPQINALGRLEDPRQGVSFY